MSAPVSTQEIRDQHETELLVRSLDRLDTEMLAFLSVVPQWTAGLLQAVSPFNRPWNEFFDEAVRAGWGHSEPLFIPGECLITIVPKHSLVMESVPAAKFERFEKRGSVAEMVSALATKRGNDPQEITLSSAEVTWRSRECEFSVREICPPGSSIRIRITPFSDESGAGEPIRLEGEVADTSGNEWSGYQIRVKFPASNEYIRALYSTCEIPRNRQAQLPKLLRREWPGECKRVAQQLEEHQVRDDIPPLTRRWLKLAQRLTLTVPDAPRRLIRRVSALLKRNLTSEANEWIKAGRVLAMFVGGELESTIRVAERRLELHQRAEVDKRMLERFFRREEQIKPFEELMSPNSPEWALHYIGVGGVGKTMLLRYLNRELLRENKAVARVDFDHLPADFPVKRPAQLLLELADGLQFHIRDSRGEYALQEMQSRADYIHRELQAQIPSDDPLGSLHRPEFESVVQAFADFVRDLPQPVVLILDTCEELARLQPDGRFQPGVQAMFEILERVQGALGKDSGLKVVFAGRRLLALSGSGWEASGANLSERQQQFLRTSEAQSGRKDYLLLHEIRGFTENEAIEYLEQALPTQGAESITKK